MYDDLICKRLYGELVKGRSGNTVIMPLIRIPEEFIDDPKRFKESKLNERLVLDGDGKLVEFAYIYAFKYESGLDDSDKYPAMKAFWGKDTCPTRKIYENAAVYYQQLKAKYDIQMNWTTMILIREVCHMEGNKTPELERWSSLEEISKHLGVSKDTIRGWIKKETIPYYKVGRQYKFKVSEVDMWIHSGESADADK